MRPGRRRAGGEDPEQHDPLPERPGTGEGLAIARRQGIELQTFLEAVGRSSGDSFALRNHGMKAMLEERYPEGAFPSPMR